jgi:hypothetical protein
MIKKAYIRDMRRITWDGVAWSVVPVKLEATNVFLAQVAVGAEDNVWIVGDYRYDVPFSSLLQGLALHWGGDHWRLVPLPPQEDNVALNGIAVANQETVWAVGMRIVPGFAPWILRWAEGEWQEVRDRSFRRGDYPSGVTAIAADDVWVIGRNLSGTGEERLALHWDGIRWVRASEPDAAHSTLFGVAAIRPNEAWAVGWSDTAGNTRTLIQRYTYQRCS